MASEQIDRTRDFQRSVSALIQANGTPILAFFLSFVVIANLWFDQHRALHAVIANDPLVTRLVVAWTLTIVVLPFPTSLVAQAGSQATTKILYIGTIALSSVLLAVLCWAIGRNRAIRDSDARPDLAPAVASLFCYAVALTIMLLVPRTSYYPLLLLFLSGPGIRFWRRVRSMVPGRRPAPGDRR